MPCRPLQSDRDRHNWMSLVKVHMCMFAGTCNCVFLWTCVCLCCMCVCMFAYLCSYVCASSASMYGVHVYSCMCMLVCVCALERTVVTFNLLRSNILNYFYIFTPLPFCVCLFATVHMWRSVLSFLHTGLGSELRSSSWAAGASIQRSISPACMLFNLFISLWFFSLVLGIESHHWPSPLILDYMFISENL